MLFRFAEEACFLGVPETRMLSCVVGLRLVPAGESSHRVILAAKLALESGGSRGFVGATAFRSLRTLFLKRQHFLPLLQLLVSHPVFGWGLTKIEPDVGLSVLCSKQPLPALNSFHGFPIPHVG